MRGERLEYRAVFDADITFANGGGLTAHDFRVDIPAAEVDTEAVGRLFVSSLDLLLSDSVKVRNLRIVQEQHKGTRNGPSDPRSAVTQGHSADDPRAFFPPEPDLGEPDDIRQARVPWWAVPADEIPVLHPVSQTLAVTPHVAIALIGVHVYRDGVEFRVERRLRRDDLDHRAWQELNNVFMAFGHEDVPNDGRLRYGVQLSDGERVVDGSVFLRGHDPSAPPETHVLNRGGGGGQGDAHASSAGDELWLWPLPPAGLLEFVMQWPAMGIPENRVTLDATPFGALAQRAAPLWPDQVR